MVRYSDRLLFVPRWNGPASIIAIPSGSKPAIHVQTSIKILTSRRFGGLQPPQPANGFPSRPPALPATWWVPPSHWYSLAISGWSLCCCAISFSRSLILASLPSMLDLMSLRAASAILSNLRTPFDGSFELLLWSVAGCQEARSSWSEIWYLFWDVAKLPSPF